MTPILRESEIQTSLLRFEPAPPMHGLRRPESIQSYEGRKPCRRQARSAFTLIELLVVIAIIAVLAAMLLPALSSAKNRAQTVIDLNNVHQILLAAHLYASDNNGYLPQPGWVSDESLGYPWNLVPSWCFSYPPGIPPGNGDVNSYNTWYPRQVQSFKGIKWNDGSTIARNYRCQFVPYLKNVKVLRCPADIPNALFYKRQEYISSYVWNLAIIGNNEAPGVTINGCGIPSTLRLSQFRADDILMWENDELLVTVNGGQWEDTQALPSEGISARHGKGGTVGNADGSAERILLSTFYMMAANKPVKCTGSYWEAAHNGQRLPNRLWCNPLRADGAW